MDAFAPSDLKTILHSKRANLYYLEHCRVLVKGGRVEYVTDTGKRSLYWNIPIANTTTVLLGSGTSITQAAMRDLSRAGVVVGFCGGGGTPLFCASEHEAEWDAEIYWQQPQSEYRDTGYLQRWCGFWFDEDRRLQVAKHLQRMRLAAVRQQWLHNARLREQGWTVDPAQLQPLLDGSRPQIDQARNQGDLLVEEMRLTKALYALACRQTGVQDFVRAKHGTGIDAANRFLDQGNYLAYGLAASCLWVLGIPFGLAVLHGKTRRGALVFDIADLIKDALILPQAFLSASEGQGGQEFRDSVIELLVHAQALDFLIESVKSLLAGVEAS